MAEKTSETLNFVFEKRQQLYMETLQGLTLYRLSACLLQEESKEKKRAAISQLYHDIQGQRPHATTSIQLAAAKTLYFSR